MAILPDMDAACMLLHPRVAVFLQVNIVTAAEKIMLRVIPVNHSGVIIMTITA
jgi:hypothetical protein